MAYFVLNVIVLRTSYWEGFFGVADSDSCARFWNNSKFQIKYGALVFQNVSENWCYDWKEENWHTFRNIILQHFQFRKQLVRCNVTLFLSLLCFRILCFFAYCKLFLDLHLHLLLSSFIQPNKNREKKKQNLNKSDKNMKVVTKRFSAPLIFK